MKRNRKMLALVAATMLTVSSSPMAFGAGTVYSTTKDQSSVNTTTLDKYLVMKKDATIPAASFDFTISSEEVTAVAADKDNKKLAVLKGIGAPELYIGSTKPDEVSSSAAMTFAAADTAANEELAKTTGDTPVFVTKDAKNTDADVNKDEKYVKKTLTIDFSGVAFTEPGVYRYLVTETGSNVGVINGYMGTQTVENVTTPVTETIRTLDVYVQDANKKDNGKPVLTIAGYTMYDGKVEGAPFAEKIKNDESTPDVDESRDSMVAGETKNSTITNIYESQNLTFAKAVTGNQGSKDKYFKFTVTIGGLKAENLTLSADLTGADTAVPENANAATLADYKNKTNPATLVVDTTKDADTDGYTVSAEGEGENKVYTITASYYLQNGQYITIKGLPKTATYVVSEDEEDYTKTNGIIKEYSPLDYLLDTEHEGNDALADAQSGTIADKDIFTGYTNNRTGAIPTGVIASIAGPIALVGIGIVGAIGAVIYLKKKKTEEEN